MIAITGGSGSGKTTLARALVSRLGEGNCALITEDHYYLPRDRQSPQATGWSNEEVEARINFDDPGSKDMALFREQLTLLRKGEAIDQPVYDFAAHNRIVGASHRVEARPVVIVEGVHVLSDPSFRPLFDLTVFVDAAADLRLIRRIRRDGAERGRSAERVIRQYLAFVRAAHAAYTEPARQICDLVVADDGPTICDEVAPSGAAIDNLVAPVWARIEAMLGDL
ncbi:MAG: AAA family ATPase [Alphaproteobacteria bacterium]|nr:AAA family ATPase [Alphaproteobacteria bacterium]